MLFGIKKTILYLKKYIRLYNRLILFYETECFLLREFSLIIYEGWAKS